MRTPSDMTGRSGDHLPGPSGHRVETECGVDLMLCGLGTGRLADVQDPPVRTPEIGRNLRLWGPVQLGPSISMWLSHEAEKP